MLPFLELSFHYYSTYIEVKLHVELDTKEPRVGNPVEDRGVVEPEGGRGGDMCAGEV